MTSAAPVRGRAGTQELSAGTMVGDYRVEGKLGEGGMGQVFAAVHPVIGKRAAIKVIRAEQCANPESVERFVQEARAVNQIGHPNIVDVFAFGTLPDGRPYLMMEWLKGESLAQRLSRCRLSPQECYEILDAVARALEAAHDKRIIHRDLKPDNVFLAAVKGEQALVKLLDFGIAKLVGNDDTRVERTATGALLGTPRYISPEQARGRPVDSGADVYSLGAMAFEMFTGQPPFVADNAMDLIAQHLHDEAPSARAVDPNVSPAIEALLSAMLDKDPAGRPDLAEVREVLAAERDRPTAVAAAAIEPAERRNAGIWTWSLAGLAAAGIAAAAVLALRGDAATNGSEPVPAPLAAVTVDAGAPAVPAPAAITPPVGPPPIAADAPLAIVVEGSSRARVLVDGREVLRSGTRANLRLPAGAHEIIITAPGRQEIRRQVEIAEGQPAELHVQLRRSSTRPTDPPPARPDPPARAPDAGIKARPPTPPPPPAEDPEGLVNPFGDRTR